MDEQPFDWEDSHIIAADPSSIPIEIPDSLIKRWGAPVPLPKYDLKFFKSIYN